MDPTTTLFTFMLQTHPSVNMVHLVGSWDNFSRTHAMERDSRRDAGQWRGCHSFKNITCDGDSSVNTPRRNGGLKMGHTYYYYYELDGTSETHDPSLPSTNTCPYLPGQTVNTLWIPVEQTARKRSASLNSLRDDDYMTMKPADKFVTPRPPPSVPSESTAHRVGTAPMHLQHKRSARSLSPAGWTFSPRKLFTRKSSSTSLKDRGQSPTPTELDERNPRAGEGSRSRDISPESLRRFLVDDNIPEEEYAPASDRPAIAIPEDIVEENEDDDNFATSATVSESLPFTGLSPPPQRSLSPSPAPTIVALNDALSVPAAPTRPPPSVPIAAARFSLSENSSLYSPQSPRSPGSNSLPSFYHSDDEDDDDYYIPAPQHEDYAPLSPLGCGGTDSMAARNLDATLSTYSLPQTSDPNQQQKKQEKLSLVVPPSSSFSNNHRNTLGSPALVARGNGADEVPQMGSNNLLLLTSPIPNSGLDDLIHELGWMADIIRA
ncbi:hypothetical protein QBC37DRAFT_203712 [Rhypophila decipiens]|uniref:Uncharacterized protein n=1 Tax=Rhypophila decipiens TaxID=261697 RepID=A0AAN7B6L5_9PEZI|nr:hypothetical protein QBC37DRAFT_203712 [Rhypophila decipiens]